MEIYNQIPELEYFMSWIGLAIAGVVSAIAGIWSNYKNRKEQRRRDKRQNAQRKLEADRARELDLEQWNRENTYENPQQQMLRLKGAGLNPNLVYGSTSPAGTSAHLGQYQAPQVSHDVPSPYGPSIQGGISDYMDMRLKQAQTDNVKQASANARTQNIGTAMDNVMKSKKIPKAKRWADKQLELLEHSTDTEYAKSLNLNQSTSNMAESRKLLTSQIGASDAQKVLTQANAQWQKMKNQLAGVMTKDQFIIKIIQSIISKYKN